jgi:hypothetical protein
MNMFIVRNKLTFSDFSDLTRIDQDCHIKFSIYLLSAMDKSSLLAKAQIPSQQSERNFEVLDFSYKKSSNIVCLCVTNFV